MKVLEKELLEINEYQVHYLSLSLESLQDLVGVKCTEGTGLDPAIPYMLYQLKVMINSVQLS